jgi:hypothetical protein
MRVPRGPKYRTLVSQVRCEGDRNHHQASRQFQYPITPGVGDPCWDLNNVKCVAAVRNPAAANQVMVAGAVSEAGVLAFAAIGSCVWWSAAINGVHS